jgi:hypothetical protein
MSSEPPSKRARTEDSLNELRTLTSSAERVRALKPLAEKADILEEFVAAGGLQLLGDWLSDSSDVGCQLGVLGVLEKVPMSIELLRTSLLGRTLNDLVRKSSNSVLSTKGQKLINSWKALVPGPAAPASSSQSGRPVVAAKSAAPPPAPQPAPVRAEPARTTVQAVQPRAVSRVDEATVDLEEEDEEGENGGFGLFDELAALAESLGTLGEGGVKKKTKKKLRWRQEVDLAEVREFSVEGAPLEVSSAATLHLDGLHSLHSTEEGHVRSFNEIRRKERRSGGEGLRNGGQEQRDLDDEIQAVVSSFQAPVKWSLIPAECQYIFRGVKSYEKQDLADMHGSRLEIFYPDAIPSDPQEPSSSSAFAAALAASASIHAKTVVVKLRNPPEFHQTAFSAVAWTADGEGSGGSFADEFVKLDSEVQRLIMGSENLLKFFKENPSMLRGLTVDTINNAIAPVSSFGQSAGGGGISGIASAIKSHARANVQHRKAMNVSNVVGHAGNRPSRFQQGYGQTPNYRGGARPPPHFQQGGNYQNQYQQ